MGETVGRNFNNPIYLTDETPSNGQAPVWDDVQQRWRPQNVAIGTETPSPTVTGPDALDTASSPGVANTFSRGDHDHGLSIPVALPSGPGHFKGLVPDPGPVAGTTKFLREDMTFQVPPGGSGGGSSPHLGFFFG